MAVNNVDIQRYAPRFVLTINGVDLSPEVSHAVTSLEISQQLNQNSSFRCTVQDTFDGFDFRWLGSELFKFGNEVSIALGYSNLLLPALEGKIQNIAPEFASGTAPSFSFGGSDRGYTFLTTPGESRTFADTRDSDIVRRIAQDAKLQAVVDQTSRSVTKRMKASGGTYLGLLRLLASENNYQFRLSGRTLYFRRPRSTVEPVMNLAWGKDLISFRPVLSTEQTATRVVVRARDPVNKETIEGTATAGDEQQRAQDARPASEITRDAEGEVVRHITNQPVRSVEEARNLAVAELENASNHFMTGNAEIVGAPELWPGDYVMLTGLGKWFSGIYCIERATHRIDAQGYRTSLELKRNAL